MGLGMVIITVFLMAVFFTKTFSGDNPNNHIPLGFLILIVAFLIGFIYPKIGGRIFYKLLKTKNYPMSQNYPGESELDTEVKVKNKFTWFILILLTILVVAFCSFVIYMVLKG